jgi:tetratricopeptide (TPR) repeat protein
MNKRKKNIPDNARGNLAYRAGKISPALKARVLRDYRETAARVYPLGDFDATYIRHQEPFEKEYARALDPAAADFEDAGDSVSAINSRVDQASRYLQDARAFNNPSSYFKAAILYTYAGENQKALDAVNSSLRTPAPGNNSFSVVYREKALELRGELEKKIETQNKRIERRRAVSLAASIVGFIGGIFFINSNITGNAIMELSSKTTSFLGIGLLLLGFVAGLFWLRKK